MKNVILQNDRIKHLKEGETYSLVSSILKEKEILSYYHGNMHPVPGEKEKSFESEAIYTGDFGKLYFTNNAIKKFEKEIYLLDKKCMEDSVKFVSSNFRDKTDLYIYLYSYTNENSLELRKVQNENMDVISVIRTVPMEQKNDIDLCSKLIDIHTDRYGKFDAVYKDLSSMIGYNDCRLKVVCLPFDEEIEERVYTKVMK